MSEVRKLLFVCSRNQCRSLTAERLFEGVNGYETRSGGTERGAKKRIKEEDIAWADFIFCMEHRHLQRLRADFKKVLAGKRLICLQIPDTYGYMSFELRDILKERLSLYIDVPE